MDFTTATAAPAQQSNNGGDGFQDNTQPLPWSPSSPPDDSDTRLANAHFDRIIAEVERAADNRTTMPVPVESQAEEGEENTPPDVAPQTPVQVQIPVKRGRGRPPRSSLGPRQPTTSAARAARARKQIRSSTNISRRSCHHPAPSKTATIAKNIAVRFMELAYELAQSGGATDDNNEASLDRNLDHIAQQLAVDFPGQSWDRARIKNKWYLEKARWQHWQVLFEMPGISRDPETGLPVGSEKDRERFLRKYHRWASLFTVGLYGVDEHMYRTIFPRSRATERHVRSTMAALAAEGPAAAAGSRRRRGGAGAGAGGGPWDGTSNLSHVVNRAGEMIDHGEEPPGLADSHDQLAHAPGLAGMEGYHSFRVKGNDDSDAVHFARMIGELASNRIPGHADLVEALRDFEANYADDLDDDVALAVEKELQNPVEALTWRYRKESRRRAWIEQVKEKTETARRQNQRVFLQ